MPLFGSYVHDIGINVHDNPYMGGDVVVPYDIASVVVGVLELRAQNTIYADGSAYTGVQLVRSIQAMVIVQSAPVSALYRLMDSALYGRVYTADVDGIITPDIPIVPDATVEAESMLAYTSNIPKTVRLLENALNGTIHAGDYDTPIGVREQLATIITNMGAEDATIEDIASNAELILAVLGAL